MTRTRTPQPHSAKHAHVVEGGVLFLLRTPLLFGALCPEAVPLRILFAVDLPEVLLIGTPHRMPCDDHHQGAKRGKEKVR